MFILSDNSWCSNKKERREKENNDDDEGKGRKEGEDKGIQR